MNVRDYILVNTTIKNLEELILRCPLVGEEQRRVDLIRRKARNLIRDLLEVKATWDEQLNRQTET